MKKERIKILPLSWQTVLEGFVFLQSIKGWQRFYCKEVRNGNENNFQANLQKQLNTARISYYSVRLIIKKTDQLKL